MIQLHAAIHRLTMDNEGESSLTIKIPKSDLQKTQGLKDLTEKVLIVTIEAK